MEIVENFFSFTRDVIGFFLFSRCSKAEYKKIEDMLQIFDRKKATHIASE